MWFATGFIQGFRVYGLGFMVSSVFQGQAQGLGGLRLAGECSLSVPTVLGVLFSGNRVLCSTYVTCMPRSWSHLRVARAPKLRV